MKMIHLETCFLALMIAFLQPIPSYGIVQTDLCSASINKLKNIVRVTKNQLSGEENTTEANTWIQKVQCQKDLNQRSLCHWDCYENYNAQRYPQIIEEKICQEREHAGLPNSCRIMDSDEMLCANLTTSIPVLELVQHCNHFDIYQNRTIQINTGCSCINVG